MVPEGSFSASDYSSGLRGLNSSGSALGGVICGENWTAWEFLTPGTLLVLVPENKHLLIDPSSRPSDLSGRDWRL